MRHVFGICSWISEHSQLPELRRCLESVRDYRVILVDGKWYDMDSPHHTSIREAYDIFKEYPNVEVISSVSRHEWENRNLYLERCSKDDILIWLDTDEWLVQSQDLTCDDMGDSPCFLVRFHDKRMGGFCYQRRGFRYPSETRHTDRHNQLWYHNQEIMASPGPAPDTFVIYQDKNFRSVERECMMKVRGKLRPYR